MAILSLFAEGSALGKVVGIFFLPGLVVAAKLFRTESDLWFYSTVVMVQLCYCSLLLVAKRALLTPKRTAGPL